MQLLRRITSEPPRVFRRLHFLRRCCCRRGRAGQGIQLMDQPEASHVAPTSSAYAARYGGGAFGSGAAGAPKALAEGGRATGV